MGQPYVGEIRMFAGNFPPLGWELCQGQQIPISENETLYQLIGTTYGGDGQDYFNLPDLQGRLPMHMGAGHTISEIAGVESVTLTTQQIPVHSHPVLASSNADVTNPVPGAIFANESTVAAGVNIYAAPGAQVAMAPAMVQASGGSQPHENMQPYLCVNFIISMFGIFPSPT